MTVKADAAEVLVKLVVDSNAEQKTEELAHGLDRVEKRHKQWVRGLFDARENWDQIKRGAAVAMSVATTAAVAAGAAVVGLATASTHAWLESEAQIRALAGTMALLDTSGVVFKDLIEVASGFKDELDVIAMTAGTTGDAMMVAYTNVLERGGKTVDQAKELVETMSQAGRAVPGGAEVISEAFEQIEMGIVRAKNPIVGMIAATHLLKGNAKQVAAQMMKMDPGEQMKLAEKAVTAMGEKMKDVPLTIGEMTTSMQVFIGNLGETAGKPIVESLTPVVGIIKDMFFDNEKAFSGMAKSFGEGISKVVDVAGPVLMEVFKVIKENSDDIKSAFEALYGPGKELFTYIYENRTAFAGTIGSILKDIIKVTSALIKAAAAVRDAVGFVLKAVAKIAVPGFGQFAAEEEQAAQLKTMRTAVTGISGKGETISDKDFKFMRDQFIKTTEEAGGDVATAGSQFDKSYRRAMEDHQAMLTQTAKDITEASASLNAPQMAAAFDRAAKAQDEGAKDYIAKFLAGNEMMQKMLIEDGPKIFQTGIEGFYASLERMGRGDVAKKLQTGMSETAKKQLTIGKGPSNTQIFTGNIQVNQDFKDENPERVAVVFRNDLAKHGLSRVQAWGAIPGG